jgi:hypothetical protein
LNWGTKIITAFAIFMIATLSIVIYFMTQRVDVVTENYYEKELKYQDQINRIARTIALKDTIKINNTGKELLVKFPNTPDKKTGKDFILLYRPSDKLKDIRIPVLTDTSNSQVISIERIEKGYWKLQINWTSSGSEYYHESVFNVY